MLFLLLLVRGGGAGGKSAILTALCVAFGCRAKNTQRAASLKDFIKTGCSYASILVDISNHGEDAFKPEVFGNVIILERRITESSSSTVLKDQHGRKVAHRKDDLVEIIEHFNIDVENPCVIMSQDKSREFLHSGNDKDKFKFFFKATLLQQVNDLLGSIRKNLNAADSIVEELERSIMPVLKELDDIQDKIKYMEHIEEIAHEIENLKKKLAWAWVYDVDKKIGEQTEKLEKLRERIPACQERIDRNTAIIEELSKELIVKKENVRSFLEKTQEVRRMKEKMQHDIHEDKAHYEGVMEMKVLAPIQMTESELTDLQKLHQEYFEKASRICAESEVEALGGVGGSTLEQLSDCINKLNQKFQQESRRYTKNIDDLRALHDKMGRKILRKQQMYEGFRGKLNACQKALDLRWRKFQRNTGLLKRQLTWLFNEHLGKKGISGHINVHYKNEVLSVELTMPQDASRDTVRDTRGLSGGERSFSTLCFTLALHGMTEAPFRAMDEFDVFMDAVSRKISLDTLVDFAVAQGSQWIFITPHDISMVKAGDRIKKQQMAAPRG